jgi:hypothetical protein
MQKTPEPIVIADLRGGRNDTDPPMSLNTNQCTEALNVDWKDTSFAHKRGGATVLNQSGGTAFSSGIWFLFRHLPGLETAAEMWAADDNVVKRLAASASTWADVTLDDAWGAGKATICDAVSFNGKLWITYDTAVDRLHVYDPGLASPRIRRVGFATPAAPTAANTAGGGAYAAVIGYWRVRWIQVTGTTLTRRSEAGPSVSFTPDGAHTGVVITQPTVAGEGETHWEVEFSADNVVWYQALYFEAANYIAIGTTTATTTTAYATIIAGGAVPPVAGFHARFPSCRFIMTEGNRLLGAGAYEASGADSGGKESRIWFTPVLGASDKGDDERVENTTVRKGWVDLNEKDGGGVTGCGGPINGQPWFFKSRQVWKLLPTGDAVTPYLPRKVRDDIGCPWDRTITIGEDQFGRPALYFLSHRGPYRITYDGDIQYLGRDNEVTWRAINQASTVKPHAVFYPDLHQWWVFIPTLTSSIEFKMMLDVQHAFPDEKGHVRGGWAKHTGITGGGQSSCLFSNTPGATMSADLKPHVGSELNQMYKCDTSGLDDNGTDFQAYVTTRPLLATKDLLHKMLMREPTVMGKALAGSDVSVSINRDFGKETRTQSVSLAPAASETRVIQKVPALEMGEADVIQVTVGDASANEEVWSVDAVIVPMEPKERR